MAKNTVVLDTNVLLYDTDCLDKFGGKDIIIPIVVIDELDLLKDDLSNMELAHASREITRKILELAQEESDYKKIKDLKKGIRFNNINGEESSLKLYSLVNKKERLSVDDYIIKSSKELDATLITRDNNMILKASGRTDVELYYSDSIRKKEVYKGYLEVLANDELFEQFATEKLLINDPSILGIDRKLYPNEFLILINENFSSSKLYGIAKGDMIKWINLDLISTNGMILKPKGISQKLAFYLINDPSIDAISFIGGSGTGKTSIAVDYGLNQVNKKYYNQLYYAKSLKGLSKDEDYGAVPGEVDDKMQEVVIPLTCTLEMLESRKVLKGNNTENKRNVSPTGDSLLVKYVENGLIKVLPLNYLRGMTISNKIVILDEGQNLTKSKMKTLVTRVASDSKLIVTGDDNQIDDNNLNKFNNGLAHLIEQGKEETFIGHLTLDLDEESKRGKLSSFGNRL